MTPVEEKNLMMFTHDLLNACEWYLKILSTEGLTSLQSADNRVNYNHVLMHLKDALMYLPTEITIE